MAEVNRYADYDLSDKENKMKTANLSLLFALALMLATALNAKTVKYVELGINQSKFRNQECKSKIGPSLGLGFDYYPVKSFAAFIGTELLYQNKKLLVENKTWPTSLFTESSSEVITGDLDINLYYMELPIKFGYSFKLSDQFLTSILAGYSLSIPLNDKTDHLVKSVRQLAPSERGKYNFDYVLVDESGVSWSKNFNVGLRLSYNHFALMLNYLKALSFTKDIEGINIQGKIDSYKASLAFLF